MKIKNSWNEKWIYGISFRSLCIKYWIIFIMKLVISKVCLKFLMSRINNVILIFYVNKFN